jgi:hypothetical protein
LKKAFETASVAGNVVEIVCKIIADASVAVFSQKGV